MKKFAAWFVVLAVGVVIVGCGEGEKKVEKKSTTVTTEKKEEKKEDVK